MRLAIAFSMLHVGASGHAVIWKTKGANGVDAPGACGKTSQHPLCTLRLSTNSPHLVLDGTPRDCVVNACGAQADTAIMRDSEISDSLGPLGWTQGNKECYPLPVLCEFMTGVGIAPNYTGGRNPTGEEDDLTGLKRRASIDKELHMESHPAAYQRDFPLIGSLIDNIPVIGPAINSVSNAVGSAAQSGFSGLAGILNYIPFFGGLAGSLANNIGSLIGQFLTGNDLLNLPVLGGLGLGGSPSSYPEETIVSELAGKGKESGLPTTTDDCKITLVWRQINQDGAGPVHAEVDPTSCGVDIKAFQSAEVTKNVPGIGVSGLSLARNTNFDVEVELPSGTECTCSACGADNICFVRVRNDALAGPFGGSGFFTQSDGCRKRAAAHRFKKRFHLNRVFT